MAVKDVHKEAVESALEEFRRTDLEAMLEKYGGKPSTKWYVEVGNSHFDQKLVVRAAHVLQGLGYLYPRGPGSFDADQARNLLEQLGYRVVPKLSPTDENLTGPSATGPLARWLIGAVRQSTTLTYDEVASRLAKECGFSRIPRASWMGKTVAALQYAIHARDPSAPLLNVLLVRKDTGQPGIGAQEFLAARYPDEARLGQDGVDTAHPELWTRFVRLATDEAHRYPDWGDLYAQLVGRYVPDPFYAPPGDKHRPPRGGGGEGPNHRALRRGCRIIPSASPRVFVTSRPRQKSSCCPLTVSTSSTARRVRSSRSRSSPGTRTGPTSGEASISASSTAPSWRLRRRAPGGPCVLCSSLNLHSRQI